MWLTAQVARDEPEYPENTHITAMEWYTQQAYLVLVHILDKRAMASDGSLTNSPVVTIIPS